jgi:hypothetical protein
MDIRNKKSKLIYNINEELIPGDHWLVISPDNKSIYYIKEEKESDIWTGYLK